MNILLFGSMVPNEYEDRIKYLSNAANRYLINVKEAFEANGDKVRCISYIGFPIEGDVKSDLQNGSNENFTFIFKEQGLKNCFKAYWEVKKNIILQINWADCLIVYNVDYIWCGVSRMARKHKKHNTLILADYSDSSSYNSIARKVYAMFQLRNIRSYEKVVGLSELTRRYLKPNQKFVCVEGGISKEVYDYFRNYKGYVGDGNIRLMYGGLLEYVTGIDILLESFIMIDNPCLRLIISGKGNLKQLVEEYAKKDERIVYIGCVSYDNYLEYLNQADILINPRNMSLPENQNNFPSKIMEYLATGKLIVSTKFPGWERFCNNIVFCDNNTENMRDALEVCSQFLMDVSENETKDHYYLFFNDVKYDLYEKGAIEQYLWENRVIYYS